MQAWSLSLWFGRLTNHGSTELTNHRRNCRFDRLSDRRNRERISIMNTGIIATRYATALLKLVDETGSGEAVAAQVQVIEKALGELPDFRRAVDDPAVSAAKKLSLFEAALSSSVAEPAEATVVRQAHQPVTELAEVAVVRQGSPTIEVTGLAPELQKFLELLLRNGRIGDVRLILTTFITEYYRSRHIKRARLVVADPALLDPEPAEGAATAEQSLRQAQRPVGEPRRTTVTEPAEVTVPAEPRLVSPAEPRLVSPVEPPTLESRLRDLIEKRTGCKLILKTEVNPSLIGGFIFEVEDTVLDASVSRQLDIIRRQFIEKNRRIV